MTSNGQQKSSFEPVNLMSKLICLVKIFQFILTNIIFNQIQIQVCDPIIEVSNPVDHVMILYSQSWDHLIEDQSSRDLVVILKSIQKKFVKVLYYLKIQIRS